MSPEKTVARKPEGKRLRAFIKKEECMDVPVGNNLQKQKPKPEAKKPEWPKRARREAMLIQPTEGVSYAAILKDLKKRVKPDEQGVTVQKIRETRSENTC